MDIALAVEADGIHFGQHDLPIGIVRTIVGDKMILGGSVHSILEYEKMIGADYFGVGSVYPSRSKKNVSVGGLDIIKSIRKLTDHPIIGIGGINSDNLSGVIQSGADGVAVISAILGENNIKEATSRLMTAIKDIKSHRNDKV